MIGEQTNSTNYMTLHRVGKFASNEAGVFGFTKFQVSNFRLGYTDLHFVPNQLIKSNKLDSKSNSHSKSKNNIQSNDNQFSIVINAITNNRQPLTLFEKYSVDCFPQFYNKSTFSSINFIYLHTGTSPPRSRDPVDI